MKRRNKFTNPNVDTFVEFIFRRRDSLPGVSLYFLSKRYATSPRYFPLYQNTNKVRIVLVQGSYLPGLDRIILRLLPLYVKMLSRKFSKYKWFFLFSLEWSKTILTNQILNFDDPEYTDDEISAILNWENFCTSQNLKSVISCTSKFTSDYLVKAGSTSTISIIPPGHSVSSGRSDRVQVPGGGGRLRLCYASPYIHMPGDLHGGHINWDATVLINEIWPQLCNSNRFELHLIGELGQNAKRALTMEGVIEHGLVSNLECTEILSTCDVGLYPRKKDNFRQAQKITEYIGCGLAIVAFKTIDASLVEELGVGISATSVEEFISAVLNLESDRKQLTILKERSSLSGTQLTWGALGRRLDETLM